MTNKKVIIDIEICSFCDTKKEVEGYIFDGSKLSKPICKDCLKEK